MVTVKTYRGEVRYPDGASAALSDKEPMVLMVRNKAGKVIGAHREWSSWNSGAMTFTTSTARDAYVGALVAQKECQ